jgi:hypothetical protein
MPNPRDTFSLANQSTPFTPIAAPTIDDRTSRTLVRLALDWAYRASKGELNDFSAASPIVVLTEAMGFVAAELQYKANRTAEVSAVRLLQIAGIQRKLGQAAVVQLRFELQQTQRSPFIVPRGFRAFSKRNFKVGNRSRPVSFTTDRQLTIPAGSYYGLVSATCTELGTIGNLPAGVISDFSTPLTFLKRVYNPSPSSGGLNAETLEDTKRRGYFALSRRGAFTRADMLNIVLSAIGQGASAVLRKGVGRTNNPQRNAVHIYVLDGDGLPLNSTVLGELESALRAQAPIHLDDMIYVSNRPYYRLYLQVYANVVAGADTSQIAQDIKDTFERYFKPNRFSGRSTVLINELEYRVRRVKNIDFVSAVMVSDRDISELYRSVNFALPDTYYVPLLSGLKITLTDRDRNLNYSFGV